MINMKHSVNFYIEEFQKCSGQKKRLFDIAMYLSPTLAPTGCDIGFNKEFSFSLTGCHTKVKEPSLANYLFIAQSAGALGYTNCTSAKG